MPRKNFSEEQIVRTLREVEGGARIKEVCRKLGITEVTFHRWKKKFHGMDVTELRRLRQVEEENRKLKSMIADLMLDKQMLQEVLRKKF